MTATATAPPEGGIRLTEGRNPFRTEGRVAPNGNGVEDRIYDPSDLLGELAARAEDRQDLLITDPTDARMTWEPTNEATGVKGHFRLAPENLSPGVLRDYLEQHGAVEFGWGSTAHRSLCKLMDTTPERYRKMGDNPERRFLGEVRDWFSHPREGNNGFIVRTESEGAKRVVNGFVPGNFNTLDEYAIVATIMEQLDSAKQYINGVNVLNDPRRATSSFRVIFGDPVINRDQHDPASDLFCMLDIRYSPIGFTSFEASLALWRLICRNGMMRRDLDFLRVKWGQHYRENEDASHRRLFDRTAEVVGKVEQFAPMIAASVSDLPSKALGEQPEEIVSALNRMRLLPQKHHDLSLARLEARVDGPVTTEWDMLNVLTRSAHDLPSISERQQGEHRAMRLAMQPEAFTGVVQAGLDETIAKGDLGDLARRN
tara:strand:+ start:141685 stop:142968 length:1284 start_codon:yes stop_codon:yes gene_type:complete